MSDSGSTSTSDRGGAPGSGAGPDVRSGAATARLRDLAPGLPERIEASPEDIDAGLARLVLTIIELIRQVLEHQAVRRMEGGGLAAEEVERLGLALLRLEEKLEEVKDVFGLEGEDLGLDLGPLGRLV